MDALVHGLWAGSVFVSLVLIVAGLHHLRTPQRLAGARARQQAAGTLPRFTLTEATARAIGISEIGVGLAAPAAMLAPRPVQILVATAISLLGAGFVTVTLAARRAAGEDCGCLPLAAGEIQTTALPALAVLGAGVAIAVALALRAPTDVVGWEIVGGVQGALAAMWLLHYAAASALVDPAGVPSGVAARS